MRKYLGGPLHYHRTWSRFFNFFRSEKIVGTYCNWEVGEVIHAQRNTLRIDNGLVSKEFATPSLWRGIIYGWFCSSKAKRSYMYAQRLTELTPEPIAYKEIYYCGILRQSWYVSKQSECQYTFNNLIYDKCFPNREKILQSIGRFTATLHQQGVLHQDYSGGNILFNEDGSKVEMIDLNRIRFQKHISIQQGLQNFERLNIDKEALSIMGVAYAKAMNINPEYAVEYIVTHRWKKHIKQGITNL